MQPAEQSDIIENWVNNQPDSVNLNDPIQFVQENYPETYTKFLQIQKEQLKLFCIKQVGYGPGNIGAGQNLKTETGCKIALSALSIRMRDKVERLFNLLVANPIKYLFNKDETLKDQKPANESTLDTIRDLGVYAIIAEIVDSGEWGE